MEETRGQPPGGKAPKGRRWPRVLLALALLLFAATLLRTAWVCDDAYLDFRVVDNFFHGYGLRWNVADRVQAFTSPLWVLIVGVAHGLTGDFFYTSIALGALLSLLAVRVLVTRLARTVEAAAMGVVLLALSKAFMDFSTSGLENSLIYLLLVAFWVTAFSSPAGLSSLSTLAAMGGLLSLARMDAVLPVVPFLLYRTMMERSPKAWARLALGFAPLLAWMLFSVAYYGFPFPNTAYAKLDTGIPAGELLRQGLRYLESSARLDPLTPAVIVMGALLGLVFAIDFSLLAGMLLSVAYTIVIGGDFMSGRFLTIPFLLGVVLLVRLPVRWTPRKLAGVTVAATALALLSPSPSLFADYGHPHSPRGVWKSRDAIDANGVADERLYYYRDTGFLVAKHVSPVPIGAIADEGVEDRVHGRRLDGRFATVVEGGSGMLSFAAGPGVHYVDRFALAEPFLARLPAMHGWRIGHFARSVPDGYLRSLSSGKNHLGDPKLAQYYDKLELVTRGDVFSRERWSAILDLNLGPASHLLDDYRRVHSRTTRVRLEDLPSASPADLDASGPRTYPFSDYGIDVDLGRLLHPRRVELSLDNEDDYRLDCRRKDRLIWEEIVPMNVPASPELATHACTMDPDATERGCDVLSVRPVGDGEYSLGHVRIEE
jgi:arabinofuranosyltransferase